MQGEFVKDGQEFIVKIRNYEGKEISGKIVPENPYMNIRFNQIRLANGEYDGPFGRQLNYVVNEGGEIWLVIGKSIMACGPASESLLFSGMIMLITVKKRTMVQYLKYAGR